MCYFFLCYSNISIKKLLNDVDLFYSAEKMLSEDRRLKTVHQHINDIDLIGNAFFIDVLSTDCDGIHIVALIISFVY